MEVIASTREHPLVSDVCAANAALSSVADCLMDADEILGHCEALGYEDVVLLRTILRSEVKMMSANINKLRSMCDSLDARIMWIDTYETALVASGEVNE